MLPDEEFETYREVNPGTLEERLWRRYKWAWPENETESCWWIVNYGADEDMTKEVKFICRSMAFVKMELHRSRHATSAKLRNLGDGLNGITAVALVVNRTT